MSDILDSLFSLKHKKTEKHLVKALMIINKTSFEGKRTEFQDPIANVQHNRMKTLKARIEYFEGNFEGKCRWKLFQQFNHFLNTTSS